MFYRKNLPSWERWVRSLTGIGLVAFWRHGAMG